MNEQQRMRGASKQSRPLAIPYTVPPTDTTEVDAAIDLLERVAAALGDVAAGYVGRVTAASDILASGLPAVRAARDALRVKTPEKFSDPGAIVGSGEAARLLGLTLKGLASMRAQGRIEAIAAPAGEGGYTRWLYTVGAVQAAAARRAAHQEEIKRRQKEHFDRNRAIAHAKERAASAKKMSRNLDGV